MSLLLRPALCCLELELNKLEVMLLDSHRQSPKTKAMRSTSRRRKRVFSHHLRPMGSIDEAMGAVTTPDEEEEEDIQHIKHVAGLRATAQQDLSLSFCLALTLSFNLLI